MGMYIYTCVLLDHPAYQQSNAALYLAQCQLRREAWQVLAIAEKNPILVIIALL